MTFADAIAAHEHALTFGGLHGIPNPTLIESALQRPYSGYYKSIATKAAALTQSMATNHGFADGNKRTTLILLHLLLARSGYELRPIAHETRNAVAEAMLVAVASRAMSFGELVNWFKLRIRRAV